ncbi:MAG: hypothetical protein QNJ47_17590 [Nostocaceae cyanobacterium]|nr:hypothetical protein [Nostocaceae cyanobacterium]
MLGKNQRKYSHKGVVKYQVFGFVAPVLTTLGYLAAYSPSYAVTTSYSNDYRVCAAQLIKASITVDAASQACAKALRPRELSGCVAKIEKRTELDAVDALSSCSMARRPEDLAKCVVGITTNTKDSVNPAVFDYCGRSLLPVRFAQCVVGLNAEIEFATTRAMDTCIDATDQVSGVSSTFIPTNQPLLPANQPGVEFQPTFEPLPIPENPPIP